MLGDHEFPERDLILVVTFCVIIVTLVGQGTTLPALVRALKLDRDGQAEADRDRRLEIAARVVGIDAALQRLDQLEVEHAPASAVAILRRYHTDRRTDFVQTGDDSINGAPAADTAVLQAKLVEAERASIAQTFRAGRLTDDARRRIERELDLEDARLHHAAQSATGSTIEDIADEESG
jgi:NhaP-type Na+/H+ or K+/H+ antiporter